MTGSKHIDFPEIRSTEHFSYHVEIPHDLYYQNFEKIDNWLEINNQEKYTRIMISDPPDPPACMRFMFVDPDDCFDFKIVWG